MEEYRALVNDIESRGDSRMVLGPVAIDAIEKRLAEAMLGLRPTLKPKPFRKFEQARIANTGTANLRTMVTTPTQGADRVGSDALANLRLSPRVMMILHSLHIRSLQDLRKADEKILAKHLTMMEVKALKQRSNVSAPTPKNQRLLRTASLSPRVVKVLNAMGVITIEDLSEVTEGELRAEPSLGKTELLAVFRVCRDHDVTLKGG